MTDYHAQEVLKNLRYARNRTMNKYIKITVLELNLLKEVSVYSLISVENV